MSNIYTLPQNSKPYITGGILTLSVLTLISAGLLLGSEFKSEFEQKIITITFMAALLNVSALSAAKHLIKGSATYNLGLAGVVLCELSLSLFIAWVLTESENEFFIKLTFSLIVLSAAWGYICGIATIPARRQEVKGMRLAAIASVSALAFLFIYGIFARTDKMENFVTGMMYGSWLTGALTYMKVFVVLTILSLGLTVLTKLLSLIYYAPPPAEDELLFDYEREAMEKAAAENTTGNGGPPVL